MCFIPWIQTEPLAVREYSHDAGSHPDNFTGEQEAGRTHTYKYTKYTHKHAHRKEREICDMEGNEYLLFLSRSDSGAGVTEERVPPLE